MKKILLIIPALLTILTAAAQSPDAWQSLVDAENNFAMMSKEKSMKDAFWANLSETSVVFEKGKPANGREVWSGREANNFYLFWWPLVADIAASGDFGYTTGPAEWGGEIGNPKPTGGGYYATVWKKDAAGVWKIATDLGTGKFVPEDRNLKLVRPAQVIKSKATGKSSIPELLSLDKSYNDKLNAEKKSFYTEFIGSQGRIHRPGERPFTTPEQIKENIRIEEGVTFQFEQAGGDMAASGDMGYAYGMASFKLMQDGKEVISNTNYLRVWKKEGKEWKVVLDVIGP